MIPILISLGLFGGGGPVGDPLPTPPERIIRLSRSNGFTVAAHVIDPSDELNYLIDLGALLEEGESFVAVNFVVLTTSAALGFSIPTTGDYAARMVSDRQMAIFPKIAVDKRDAPSWSGQGTECSLEISGTTDSLPARDWQRTVRIRVAQR